MFHIYLCSVLAFGYGSLSCVLKYVYVFSPQPSVRLTPTTILYSGKSPDGSHLLVRTPPPPCALHTLVGMKLLPGLCRCSPNPWKKLSSRVAQGLRSNYPLCFPHCPVPSQLSLIYSCRVKAVYVSNFCCLELRGWRWQGFWLWDACFWVLGMVIRDYSDVILTICRLF